MQVTLIFLAILIVSTVIIYKVNGRFKAKESALLLAVMIISAVLYTLYQEDKEMKQKPAIIENRKDILDDRKITIINTGGTFNKTYNPLKGTLDIPANHKSLDLILANTHNLNINVINTITKDSLDFTNEDRELLTKTIKDDKNSKIIIIHGTDTLGLSAEFVASQVKDKVIIFTGAMVPMSISQTEATLNIATAFGYVNADVPNGVYVAMHGAVVPYNKIAKNVEIGKFLIKE